MKKAVLLLLCAMFLWGCESKTTTAPGEETSKPEAAKKPYDGNVLFLGKDQEFRLSVNPKGKAPGTGAKKKKPALRAKKPLAPPAPPFPAKTPAKAGTSGKDTLLAIASLPMEPRLSPMQVVDGSNAEARIASAQTKYGFGVFAGWVHHTGLPGTQVSNTANTAVNNEIPVPPSPPSPPPPPVSGRPVSPPN